MNTTQLIEDQPLLTREGKRGVLRNGVRFVVHLGVLLIAAGTVDWFQAWLYAGLNLCLTAIYTIVLLRHNPRLLQHNLSGYTAYTHATRYRLCPYVW